MALTNLQQGVITLVRSAVTRETLSLPDGFSMEDALPIIYAHGIPALAYMGAKNCGLEKHPGLFQSVCGSIVQQEKQDSLLKEISKSFDEARFDYIPLKGSHLKKLYPQPYLRHMSDIDILIRMEQYDSIRDVMKSMGYAESVESDHELQWHKSGVLIELHKRLIPSHNYDFFEYFGDGWDKVYMDELGHWQMTAENEFIYIFTHFVKHYRDGGIGLTHLTDLWVLRDTYDNYGVETELDKLHLLTFYKNIMKVLDACFAEGNFDEKTSFITERILSGGRYGTSEKHENAQNVRSVYKHKGIIWAKVIESVQIIFPPYTGMCQLYPGLKKQAYLLPVMWVKRIIDRLCNKRGKVKDTIERVHRIDREHVDEYRKELEYVGLDFWF